MNSVSILVFSPQTTRATPLRKAKFYLTIRADSMKFYHSGKIDETDGRRVCDGSPESMHGAAGAPPQLTDGACVAAQSTDVAALRHTLQARPLALRLHRERAIGAKSTDLCAVDFHVGRAQRADNRGSRMLSRTRAHRASGGPGGGRPSSPPERPWPGSGIKGGVFTSAYFITVARGRGRGGPHPGLTPRPHPGTSPAAVRPHPRGSEGAPGDELPLRPPVRIKP